MTALIRLGIVGVGKIARDQHLPAISTTPGIALSAAASRNGRIDGLPNYHSLEAMLAAEPQLDAVALCQPPQARFEAARRALAAGKHVFLEKPPGATVSEVGILDRLARDAGLTLFASWHSRYAAAVASAREWLSMRRIVGGRISWKEDVRRWHPGQQWIWEAGGFGVFDPGINALSILTEIMPDPVLLTCAELQIPSNRDAPIAADLSLVTTRGAPIAVELDWRHSGEEEWNITVETDGGPLELTRGGNRLAIGGVAVEVGAEAEYPQMYRRFVELIHHGQSDVDVSPLALVADAFLRGRLCRTVAFEA